MALDFYLYEKVPIECPNCHTRLYHTGDEVFWRKITHNLVPMAEKAGLYYCLWRPNENGYMEAQHIIEPLEEGLKKLRENKEQMELLNPKNGWGSYSSFVTDVEIILNACKRHPDSFIEVSR